MDLHVLIRFLGLSSLLLSPISHKAAFHFILSYFFQIDQNAREDYNLTSDLEFKAIKSLVLGKVHGK